MNIIFKRLDHIQVCIPIGKEDEAREFYCNILGLTEIEKPDALKPNGGLWLEIADIQLHIGAEDIENKSKRHPAFEVADLDSVKQYLIDNNIRIKEDTPIPNVKRFSFYDPFNNRIELLEKN